MKIVIDIPEEMYAQIIDENGIDTMLIPYKDIIKNGTPLPKGHGRLIDADAINIHNVSPAYEMVVYGVTHDDIEYEPTIIEADKTESEG